MPKICGLLENTTQKNLLEPKVLFIAFSTLALELATLLEHVGFYIQFLTTNTPTLFWYTVFPIVLAQFDVDQFRPPGWFCAGIGVLLLLLQLAVFRGECTCGNDMKRGSGIALLQTWKKLQKHKFSKLLCTVGVSVRYYIDFKH